MQFFARKNQRKRNHDKFLIETDHLHGIAMVDQVTLTVDYRHRHLTVTLRSQRFSSVARSQALSRKQISC